MSEKIRRPKTPDSAREDDGGLAEVRATLEKLKAEVQALTHRLDALDGRGDKSRKGPRNHDEESAC